MNDLYLEIDNDLDIMQDIIDKIGTIYDTITRRQQFCVFQIDLPLRIMELKQRIRKAPIDHDKYLAKVAEKHDILTQLIQNAAIQFPNNTPYDTDLNNKRIYMPYKVRRNSTISPIEIEQHIHLFPHIITSPDSDCVSQVDSIRMEHDGIDITKQDDANKIVSAPAKMKLLKHLKLHFGFWH